MIDWREARLLILIIIIMMVGLIYSAISQFGVPTLSVLAQLVSQPSALVATPPPAKSVAGVRSSVNPVLQLSPSQTSIFAPSTPTVQ